LTRSYSPTIRCDGANGHEVKAVVAPGIGNELAELAFLVVPVSFFERGIFAGEDSQNFTRIAVGQMAEYLVQQRQVGEL